MSCLLSSCRWNVVWIILDSSIPSWSVLITSYVSIPFSFPSSSVVQFLSIRLYTFLFFSLIFSPSSYIICTVSPKEKYLTYCMCLLVLLEHLLLVYPHSWWPWTFRAHHACNLLRYNWNFFQSSSLNLMHVSVSQNWRLCLQVWLLVLWKPSFGLMLIFGIVSLLVWGHHSPWVSLNLPSDDI